MVMRRVPEKVPGTFSVLLGGNVILRDDSANEFLERAGDLLYGNEALNSLMLGLSEDLCRRPSHLSKEKPWFLRVADSAGKNLSAALRTPPVNLILTYATMDELIELADWVYALDPALPGVVGPRREAENFSKLWFERTGKRAELGMAQKIYQAEHIIFPENVPGELRSFRRDEFELALEWMKEFGQEAVPNETRSEEVWRQSVERAFESQGAHLWEVDGRPVAMAHVSRPTLSTITVNYVYTPKSLRRKGYASALTAHLSAKMLLTKKRCVLYTDLANPTSNKIYQDVGYREVAESKFVLFN